MARGQGTHLRGDQCQAPGGQARPGLSPAGARRKPAEDHLSSGIMPVATSTHSLWPLSGQCGLGACQWPRGRCRPGASPASQPGGWATEALAGQNLDSRGSPAGLERLGVADSTGGGPAEPGHEGHFMSRPSRRTSDHVGNVQVRLKLLKVTAAARDPRENGLVPVDLLAEV